MGHPGGVWGEGDVEGWRHVGVGFGIGDCEVEGCCGEMRQYLAGMTECGKGSGSTYGSPSLHLAQAHPTLWRRGRMSPRCLMHGIISTLLSQPARVEKKSPVISSGKIESRTSRSSICSSRPIFPSRQKP